MKVIWPSGARRRRSPHALSIRAAGIGPPAAARSPPSGGSADAGGGGGLLESVTSFSRSPAVP